MLSPMIAAVAANTQTSGSSSSPRAESAPPIRMLVSPGIGRPADSPATIRKRARYPRLAGTWMLAIRKASTLGV